MGRRTNGTNRTAAQLNVNCFTGKIMPGKKKNLPAATGQALKCKENITVQNNYTIKQEVLTR